MALDLLNPFFKDVLFSLCILCGLHNKHIQFQGATQKHNRIGGNNKWERLLSLGEKIGLGITVTLLCISELINQNWKKTTYKSKIK